MPRVKIKGKGQTTLSKSDYIASGGEADIFAQGNTAFKIYHNPKKTIPEGKINELSVLTLPCILRPQDILLNDQNKSVGYTMRYVHDTWVLCQLFPKIFRNRNGITPDDILELVQKLRTSFQHCHQHRILIVDANELNFLVPHDLSEILHIDVDSYQTPSYPATAIMPSIQDPHSKTFSELTDFYSFGIISFQLFVGIHPYKGDHPDYGPGDWQKRMEKNISVFNPKVKLPACVYPINSIPQAYRDWYKEVFENGKRIPPPSGPMVSIAITTQVAIIVGSNKFELTELGNFPNLGDIIFVAHSCGTRFVQGTKGAMIGNREDLTVKIDQKIGFTPQMNHAISAKTISGIVDLKNLTLDKDIPDKVPGNKIMSYDGRLYTIDGESVYELQVVELPLNTRANVKLVGNVAEKASSIYDGVIIQNLLGACYVSVFPELGTHYQIRIKELETYKIIAGKFDRGVLQVVGVDQKGKYDRFVFRFDERYRTYDVRKEEGIIYSGLNFVVLDTGVCVQVDEKEQVNIFKAKKDDPRLTIVDDPNVESDMTLYRYGAQLIVAKGSKIFSMKMK